MNAVPTSLDFGLFFKAQSTDIHVYLPLLQKTTSVTAPAPALIIKQRHTLELDASSSVMSYSLYYNSCYNTL